MAEVKNSNPPWISRNPKRKTALPKKEQTTNDDAGAADDNKIPSSLTPFLGWTKMTSCCVRPRKRRRVQNNADNNEPLVRVSGRAIFFLHDPNSSNKDNVNEEVGQDNDGDDSNKPWFQGRFFPSFGISNSNQDNDHNSRVSPISVVSGVQHLLPTSSSSMNSWGLLAVQNAVEDECLLDDCGGYRELDLTIIRNKPTSSRNIGNRNANSNSNKLRWVINDIDWTGGNMMRLTSDPYSGLATLPMDENGMAFDPKTLLEGDKAIQFASKYFPSLVKRLQIQNLMNEEGTGASSSSTSFDDAMVIIGDMTIVASQSFVHPQHVAMTGADSDDDGLWND